MVSIQATPVFYRNLNSKAQVVVNRGGAGSSKSYSLCQLFLHKFLTSRKKKLLIVRKTQPSLRISVLALFKQFLREWGVVDVVKEQKRDFNFFYGNNLIHFGGLDDPEKIKSTDWNMIWMEEATEFAYEDYQVLKLRLRSPIYDEGDINQLFMTFNPVDAYHWIKTKVVEGQEESVEEIVSTYHDNPFLSQEYIRTLEELKRQDRNFHRIYAEGDWGRLEHLIYSNYKVIDKDEYPTDPDEIIYGLDFGYNHPTALIEIALKDNIPYERQLIYQTHMTNDMLIRQMNKLGISKTAPIYADSSRPDYIEEICNAGYNFQKGDKKNILEGIDFIKRLDVRILRESADLISEKQTYSWRVDRRGIMLEEPIKYKDDLMDAERYALYTHLRHRREFQFVFVGEG